MEPPIQGDSKAGLDRRTVIRRGAILGGALVWTAPAVQTIAGPAFAAGSPCTPIAILGIDRNGDGDFNDPGECIGKFTFVDGQGAGSCCDCVTSNGSGAPAVAICTGTGACTPVFTAGDCSN